jgi:hypothetical protein
VIVVQAAQGLLCRGKSQVMPQFVASRKSIQPENPSEVGAVECALLTANSAATPRFPIYDLRGNNLHGEGYSIDVEKFADRVLVEVEDRAGSSIAGYAAFVQTELKEPSRTLGEYSIELLTLGLALQRYAEAAERTPLWLVAIAEELRLIRRRTRKLKPLADFLRGAIAKWFLVGKIGLPPAEDVSGTGTRPNPSSALLDGLQRLIQWMQATGEFEQETLRLKNWLDFLRQLPRPEAEQAIEEAIGLFDWFRIQAEAALGAYASGVPRFLSVVQKRRGIREDLIFCGKESAEYHLSMVAAEIVNRGLRAGFERTASKAVLVPGCMRGAYAEACQATVSGVDIQCAACRPGCPVNRLTHKLQALGAKVYIVPHSTGFSRWLTRWQRQPDTGVVAVACLLNILPGGYEMRQRGIPSQCVPLDFPGCKKHWTSEGVATTVNQERLVQLVCPAPPASTRSTS